jgi:hypothetical protein
MLVAECENALLGVPVPKVKKAIADLKLKLMAKKGVCSYY